MIKELICAGTYLAARNELRTGLKILTWIKPEREAVQSDYNILESSELGGSGVFR
jgi:hypothetical protein